MLLDRISELFEEGAEIGLSSGRVSLEDISLSRIGIVSHPELEVISPRFKASDLIDLGVEEEGRRLRFFHPMMRVFCSLRFRDPPSMIRSFSSVL